MTYAELANEASRYAHFLADRGVELEDRVLIVLEDGLEWAAAFFGAQKLGASTAFVRPGVSDVELAFYLEDTRARALITRRSTAARLPSSRPFLRTVVQVDDPGTRAEIDHRPNVRLAAPTLEDDLAVWLYTSGSTGAPKAAVHRAGDFVFSAERYAGQVLGLSESDVTVSVPKLFFGYATGSNLLFPLYFGASAVLFPDPPSPSRIFDLIERYGATMLVNVPTMIARMTAHHLETEPKPKVHSLRLVTSAGEALPPEVYRRWKDATGVEILDGIGSAEMFHVFISARAGEVVPGSLGTLVPGYEARIVGPDGRDVPDGEVGTLFVGGGSSAALYWNRQDQSREILQGHWVRTNDLFHRDERGHFWYHGRADDILKVGGRWIQPQEVEACLTEDPAVVEAGVAPFEQDGLTKPMAFVVLTAGQEMSPALEDRLAHRVRERLAPYQAPRFFEEIPRLPRGDRDKLDRRALALLAREAVARRVGRAAAPPSGDAEPQPTKEAGS